MFAETVFDSMVGGKLSSLSEQDKDKKRKQIGKIRKIFLMFYWFSIKIRINTNHSKILSM
jgi:preprotein translocase subunit Sec63